MTLRPGTDTGSLINHIYSRATRGQPTPEVGMGATTLLWTDRHAATITAVHDTREGRWVVAVQEDRAIVIGGSTFDGSAEYRYERNVNGAIYNFRFEEGKGWRHVRRSERGRWVLEDGPGLRIGERQEYRDPSF
jgi:hypothetical protein